MTTKRIGNDNGNRNCNCKRGFPAGMTTKEQATTTTTATTTAVSDAERQGDEAPTAAVVAVAVGGLGG
jgi:hypothetical protein